MVVYQVTISLQADIEADWRDWMHRVHVPDVLRTGCFRRCVLAKAVEPAGAEVTYVMRYDCDSVEEYERYRSQFAAGLQREHTERYEGRIRGSRLVLEEVAVVEG
jgi:hypothetical protein